MEKITLKEIFKNGEGELSASLKGFCLPKDSKKIQNLVSDYFSKLFENEGTYRQSLTESEDYLLMSALQIMKSQQVIIGELTSDSAKTSHPTTSLETSIKKEAAKTYIPLLGTGVGALVGSLSGTRAAIAGAIAGTAVVIYYSTHNTSSTRINNNKVEKTISEPINVNTFVSIIEKICDSIDGVIETYRVQVQKIKKTYERREKPSLLTDYEMLTDQIANVCNIANSYSEPIPQKLLQAIKMMEESLENYDLIIKNGKIINTK